MVLVNKQSFLALFKGIAVQEGAKLFDLLEATLEYGYTTFSSDFLTPNVWKKLPEKFFDVTIETYGGFEKSDRKMICFYKGLSLREPFPIKMVKVTATSKFHTLRHKDFMGSILSCGVRREKFGDLMQVESELYVPIVEGIEPVLIKEVTCIGKSPCKIEVVDPKSVYFVENNFKESVVIVSSLRLDAVVSELSKLPREKGAGLIEAGQVMVDYEIEKSKSKEISEGTTLTIRQFGKFKFDVVLGKTGKERLKLRIKRYE
ncbi:MAG: YlmH/Sll1252 family protein [Fusobacteria bacterium]|nr:YlmH/Sll1252 family protein [Fusobacteriota bacterium]